MTSAHKTHTSTNKCGLILELTKALTTATKCFGLGNQCDSIQKVGPGVDQSLPEPGFRSQEMDQSTEDPGWLGACLQMLPGRGDGKVNLRLIAVAAPSQGRLKLETVVRWESCVWNFYFKHRSLYREKIFNEKLIKQKNIQNKNVYLLNLMNTALKLKREAVNWKINGKILCRMLQRERI